MMFYKKLGTKVFVASIILSSSAGFVPSYAQTLKGNVSPKAVVKSQNEATGTLQESYQRKSEQYIKVLNAYNDVSGFIPDEDAGRLNDPKNYPDTYGKFADSMDKAAYAVQDFNEEGAFDYTLLSARAASDQLYPIMVKVHREMLDAYFNLIGDRTNESKYYPVSETDSQSSTVEKSEEQASENDSLLMRFVRFVQNGQKDIEKLNK